MAEYSIEAWGERRADYRSALIAWVMASAWRGKGQRRPKLEDFLLKFGDDGRLTDVQQIAAVFRSLAQRGKERANHKRKA